MKRILIIVVVLAQLAVLLTMAGQREWILRHGQLILLRTVPYDPMDYMRGRYARLNYEISSVPANLCRGDVQKWFGPATSYDRAHLDARVYALLALDEEGSAHLTALTDREPTSGLYLRGRVDSVSPKWIRVRYGIEALFMQEDEAVKMDQANADRANNITLDAEVAVSKSGIAVLRKTQREPLALTLQLERLADKTPSVKSGTTLHRLVGVTARLTNYGQTPIEVILRPDGKSFRLTPVLADDETSYEWVNKATSLPPAAPADVKTIEPGGNISQHIDLNQPYWAVFRPAQSPSQSVPDKIQFSQMETEWSRSYRLEYTPNIESSAPLSNPNLFKRVVVSRRFTPVGTD